MRNQKIPTIFLLCTLCLTAAAILPVLAASPSRPTGLTGGIVNGDFEEGRTGWTEYSQHGWPVIYVDAELIVLPHSGRWAAWLGGADDEVSYIEQRVDVPMGGPNLTYWVWISSVDECDADDDSGEVRVDGTPVDTLRLCNVESTLTWVERTVDLSAYAGQAVDLQIRAETNSEGNSNLFIDDVSMAATEQTLTVNIVGEGSVGQTPDPPYYQGDEVILTPNPNSSWIFEGWSGPDAGDLVDNGDGTWSLTMDGNRQVTATFIPLRVFLPLVIHSH